MTTAARLISFLFVTPTRRSPAPPALGFTALFLSRSARSASAQPSSNRSRRATTAFHAFDNRLPKPSPAASHDAGANTARTLSP
jgi:hypothetical protein